MNNTNIYRDLFDENEELKLILEDDCDDGILYHLNYAILETKDQTQDINDILYILEKKCEDTKRETPENAQDNISLSYNEFQQLVQLARTVRYYQDQVLSSLNIIKSEYVSRQKNKNNE